MKDDSYKKEFLKLFNLKPGDKVRANFNWKSIEESLSIMAGEFLVDGDVVSFPEFICETAKKHGTGMDQNGNSTVVEHPQPIFAADGWYPTRTIVVPDEQGHLRGRIESSSYEDDSWGSPVYFGLTDSSLFVTENYGEHRTHYLDLTSSDGLQTFKPDSTELPETIPATIDEIEKQIATHKLGDSYAIDETHNFGVSPVSPVE